MYKFLYSWYGMYMRTYLVAELRKDLKEALDNAPIRIIRGKEEFILAPAGSIDPPVDVISPQPQKTGWASSSVKLCKHDMAKGNCKYGCK